MNKKLNKKGFTLIELLAVIVVLALIMVLALPSVLSTMNGAKKTTFQMFGLKVINAAIQVYEADRILNNPSSKYLYTGGTTKTAKKCYTLADLMGADGYTGYEGFVVVDSDEKNLGSGDAQFKVYLRSTNDGFIYNDVLHSTILNKSANIGTTGNITNACK